MTEIHESATCTADDGQPCVMCRWIEGRKQVVAERVTTRMSNSMLGLLESIADSYDAVRPNAGNFVRERIAVEKHNAYAWIKPNAATCHRCGRKAFATPVDGFMVRECDRCQELVCERCCDTDCDSDQDGYYLTSWTCKDDCRKGD